MDNHPLTDIWDTYNESLSTAINEGFIDDPDTAEGFVWPHDLNFQDYEREDIKHYVHDRMTEIISSIKKSNGVDPNVIAGYIFRSVISGLLWEADRIGR